MIFVTIGSQEPFDRLIKAVDEVAVELKDEEIIAQVFKPGYEVKNIKTVEFISPLEYNYYIEQADLVIAHAGMGTILSVLQLEKPLLVFPRLSKFKETRNDHQVDTAEWFEKNNYLYVAYSEQEVKEKIRSILKNKLGSLHKIDGNASPELINSIKHFITE